MYAYIYIHIIYMYIHVYKMLCIVKVSLDRASSRHCNRNLNAQFMYICGTCVHTHTWNTCTHIVIQTASISRCTFLHSILHAHICSTSSDKIQIQTQTHTYNSDTDSNAHIRAISSKEKHHT